MSKSIKNHLIGNYETGKTVCGINFQSDSIRIAELDDNNWYDDYGNELDLTNWESFFCLNCLKLHELDLINQFKQRTFLIRYELELPKSKRAMQLKKSKSKRNRIKGIKTKSIHDELTIENKKKSNPIPKSKKGIERDKKKAQSKSNPIPTKSKKKKAKPIDKPTESKCKVISKPKDKPIEDKPIELVDEIKPLIDLSQGSVLLAETENEVIEQINPDDSWSIGDPIDDDTIFELMIGSNWKLVRHNKQLDKWQFQSKQIKKGIPKWIADSEYVDYSIACELVIDGYCE